MIAQRLLETDAAAIAEFQHAVPVSIPRHAFGHRSGKLRLELLAAAVAPAAVGRPEALVEHVDVESGHAVGQLLGEELFHHLEVARVEAKPVDGFAVGRPCPELGMGIEKMPPLLHDAIGDQGKAALFASSTASRNGSRSPSPGGLGSNFEL